MDENKFTLGFLRELISRFGDAPDFSDQEWDALCGYRPMTQEIFDHCVETCANAGNIGEFLELFERFPECGKFWCERLDEEWPFVEALMKEQGIKPTPITDDEIRERWTAFRKWVRTEFGDDIADNLAEDIFNIPPQKGAI